MKVTILKIEHIFKELKKGHSKHILTLRPVSKKIFLAKTHDNNECLVIEVSKQQNLIQNYEKQIGKIVLSFLQFKKIKIKNKIRVCNVLIIRLLDSKLNKTFYGLIQAFLQKADKNRMLLLKPKEIEDYILEWALLFQSEKELSVLEKIGLWGELFFISQNNKPDKIVQKWHGPEQKTFDFVTCKEVIDIKTGLLTSEHHFRKSQIEHKNKCYFVCQRIRKSNKGMDLQGIVALISKRLKNKELFESKLAYFGYYKTPNDNTKYKNELTRWVDSRNIPQPRKIDTAVQSYEFRSETSGAVEITASQKASILKRLCH
jgi:hypothetical protein